jgi:hypothetical protein
MADSTTSQKKRATGAPRGLWLISAETGFPFVPLADGANIDLSDPSLPWHLDVGYFPDDSIQSVVYKIGNGAEIIRTGPPYPLLNYKIDPFPKGQFNPGFPGAFTQAISGACLCGPHTISATPCAGPRGKRRGATVQVQVNILESVTVQWLKDRRRTILGAQITPFTVTNAGTLPINLRGPRLYDCGQHVLASGSPPLTPFDSRTPWNREFTVPVDNINFVTCFTYPPGAKSFTGSWSWQALELLDASPLILQPGQQLSLQFSSPVRSPMKKQFPPIKICQGAGGGSGSGGGSGNPPLGPPKH